MTSLALACKLNAARTPTSLAARAVAAIRRNNGTLLLPGAATPVLGGELAGLSTPWHGVGTGAALNTTSGTMTFTASPADQYAVRSITNLTAGATYLLELTVASISGGGLHMLVAGGVGITSITTPGTYRSICKATGVDGPYLWVASGTVTAVVTAASCKEILSYTHGNPALRNYLDSAGTDLLDSVTQVDQPVGLALDSMGVLGADVVGLSTSWLSLGAGFALSGGVMTLTSAAASAFALKGVGLTASKTYQFDVVVSSLSGGSIQIQTSGNAFTISAAGTYTFIHKPGAIDGPYVAVPSGTVSAQITRLDWREIPGNHATQPTTASKPILRRGLVNQLLNSQWGGGGTAPTGWAAYGTGATEGALLPSGMRQRVFTSTAAQDFIYQMIALAANTTYTVAVTVDANPGGYVNTALMAAASVPAGATAVTASSGSVAAAGSMILMTVTTSATAGNMLLRIGTGSQNPTTGSATLSAPAIFAGTVTASQILAAGGIPLTTTAAASSARGNYWWGFDGSNDSFSTGITTGNEGWVCAGVTPANTTTAMSIVNAGEGTSTIPGVWLFNSGTGSWTASAADGSLRTQTTSPVLGTAPQVVSMGWTASTLTVGVNNTEVSTPKISAGSWSSGANVLRIGAYQGSSVPLNGPMSATVYTPVLPSAADRALIRRFVGSLQGQTL